MKIREWDIEEVSLYLFPYTFLKLTLIILIH